MLFYTGLSTRSYSARNQFSAMMYADCGEFSIVLSENHLKRMGCASGLRVFCENCGWKHESFGRLKAGFKFKQDLSRI